MEKRFHFMLAHVPRTGNSLSVENFLPDRLEELDAYEVYFAGFLLSLDPCLNRRHPGRHEAGRNDRRSRNREGDNVVDRKGARTDDESP